MVHLKAIAAFETESTYLETRAMILELVARGELVAQGRDLGESVFFFVQRFQDADNGIWFLAEPDQAFRGYLKKLSPMKFKWDKNELAISAMNGSTRKVVFEYPIGGVVEYDCILIVLLSPPVKSLVNENILSVSGDGEIVWTIAKTPHLYDDSPYTGIEATSHGVIAHNWDGITVRINSTDGTVSPVIQSK